MDFIDIGVNLAHDSFDADREAVMQRAAAVGVVQMVVTGSSEDGTRNAIELARRHPGRLYATAGVHPHHAADLTAETLAALHALARDAEVVAVGECGLDYFRDFSPRDLQRRAFAWQLELAARPPANPCSCISAMRTMTFSPSCENTGTLPGAWPIASRPRRRSAMPISSWGCTSASRAGSTMNAAACTCAKSSRAFPADRLMLETDTPYLLPRDLKPAPKTRRNEPQHLPHIARAVATARGQDLETLAREAADTTRDFFG